MYIKGLSIAVLANSAGARVCSVRFGFLSVCPTVRLSVCPSVRLSVCPTVHGGGTARRAVGLWVVLMNELR